MYNRKEREMMHIDYVTVRTLLSSSDKSRLTTRHRAHKLFPVSIHGTTCEDGCVVYRTLQNVRLSVTCTYQV